MYTKKNLPEKKLMEEKVKVTNFKHQHKLNQK